jgi:DNA-binding transcriptional ArsR family regulator
MEMSDAATALDALAQETRLGVVRALVGAGPGGRTASDIAGLLSVSPPTLSFHLKSLAAAGLIRARRQGRHVYYAADYGGIRAVIEFLLLDCCQGDPRLSGPYVIRASAA